MPLPAWSLPPGVTLNARPAADGPTQRLEIQLALKHTTCAASMPNPPRWAPLPPLSPDELRLLQRKRDSSSAVSSNAEPDSDKQQHETSTSRDDMGEAPSKEKTAVSSASADVTTTETAQSTELSRERSTTRTWQDEGPKSLSPSQAAEGETEDPNLLVRQGRADLVPPHCTIIHNSVVRCQRERTDRHSGRAGRRRRAGGTAAACRKGGVTGKAHGGQDGRAWSGSRQPPSICLQGVALHVLVLV